MKRILVTGGCGFVGSYVVDTLVKRGHEVIVIDDMSTCWLDDETGTKPKFNNPKAHYLYHNVQMINQYKDSLDEIDSIIHLAKRHPIERDKSLFENTWEGFVAGGLRLLYLHIKLRSKLKRFITVGNVNKLNERKKMLPSSVMEKAFSEVLKYNHLPPYLGCYTLYFPELVGERRLTESIIQPNIEIDHVFIAAKIISDLADSTSKHNKESELYPRGK